MRQLGWLAAALFALAAAYTLTVTTVRAEARERWSEVLDHWHTRRPAFMERCFPEAPANERELVYLRRVHPGGPLWFGEEEVTGGFPWLRERRRVLLPFWERYGDGWCLGKLELDQVRSGFAAKLIVHVDLCGPTKDRDLERLEELFGEIGVRVESTE